MVEKGEEEGCANRLGDVTGRRTIGDNNNISSCVYVRQ